MPQISELFPVFLVEFTWLFTEHKSYLTFGNYSTGLEKKIPCYNPDIIFWVHSLYFWNKNWYLEKKLKRDNNLKVLLMHVSSFTYGFSIPIPAQRRPEARVWCCYYYTHRTSLTSAARRVSVRWESKGKGGESAHSPLSLPVTWAQECYKRKEGNEWL